MHDVVVVGAGPAGSRYARQAAAAGHDVLLLESGEVGAPLACSGHVSRDLWDYTGPDARDDLLQNEVSGARFHADGPGSPSHRFHRDEPISNVIDRVELDRHLAALARDAGAEIHIGHTVTGVGTDDDGVTVHARTPDGDERFRAQLVAGCDGPTSRVRRELGLPEPNTILHGVLGFDPTPDHGDHVDVFLDEPGFFAWRIPRGEAGVEYGLGAEPDVDVAARFDALLDAHGVSVDRRCSGAIPIGAPNRTVADRGFLIGDAAGQTKPFTGGGILYGMTAADLAVDHIDPTDLDTLQAYEIAWRDALGREIALGHWLRRAYDLPAPVRELGLRLSSGRIGVHMDRPTSLFSREHLRAVLQ